MENQKGFYEKIGYFNTRVNKLKHMGEEDIAAALNAQQMQDSYNVELLEDLTKQAEEFINIGKEKNK